MTYTHLICRDYFFSVLHPAFPLVLWVDQQREPCGGCDNDAVLQWQLIIGQTLDVPFTDLKQVYAPDYHTRGNVNSDYLQRTTQRSRNYELPCTKATFYKAIENPNLEQWVSPIPQTNGWLRLMNTSLYRPTICSQVSKHKPRWIILSSHSFLHWPLTVAESVSMLIRFRSSDVGMPLERTSLVQFFSNKDLKSWLNGPAYDKNAVPSRTSPTSLRKNKHSSPCA